MHPQSSPHSTLPSHPNRSRILLFAVFLAASASLPAPRCFAAADPPACASNPDRRALDFWLGSWNINVANESTNATSSVTLDLDQCLVVERWDGGDGHTGENVFGYSADDQSWHGLFADSQGRIHLFPTGRVAAGSATFTGPSRDSDGKTELNRITIRRVSATQVEQVWQKSADGGKSWNTVFHGEYTRKRS
jgi:hypothetical protein